MRLTTDMPISSSTRAPRHRPRLSSGRGQTTIELAGLLLVVAAIVAVIWSNGLPGNVGHTITCAVARILQTGGCQASPSASKPSNVLVCQAASQTNTADDQLSVLFLSVGHNNTLIETTYSNGQVQYTLVNTGTATAQADLLKVEGDVGGYGFDAELTAAAGGQLTGSHTWTFPNAAAAKAFASKVQSAGGWGVVAHDAVGATVGSMPVVGGPLGWLGNKALSAVGINGAPDPGSLAPGNLTYSYVAAGAVGKLNGDFNLGVGPELSAELDGELKAAGGARLITSGSAGGGLSTQNGQVPLKKGDVQFFVELNGNANAALQDALLGPRAAGSGSFKGTAVVTLSPSGSLQQVQLTGSVDGTGSAGLKGSSPPGAPPGSGATEGGIAKSLNLNVSAGAGLGFQYTATLNLQNNPAARADLVSLLGAGGQSTQATGDLLSQIGTNGTQRLQPYALTRSQGKLGAELEVVDVGGGADATVSKQNQSFDPGWVKAPGQSWQVVVCKR